MSSFIAVGSQQCPGIKNRLIQRKSKIQFRYVCWQWSDSVIRKGASLTNSRDLDGRLPRSSTCYLMICSQTHQVILNASDGYFDHFTFQAHSRRDVKISPVNFTTSSTTRYQQDSESPLIRQITNESIKHLSCPRPRHIPFCSFVVRWWRRWTQTARSNALRPSSFKSRCVLLQAASVLMHASPQPEHAGRGVTLSGLEEHALIPLLLRLALYLSAYRIKG